MPRYADLCEARQVTGESDPDLAVIESLSGRLSAVLGSIADAQWSLATPCADWDLNELIDHVTGGNWFTLAILSGLSSEQAMVNIMKQFSDGSVTREQAVSSVADQLVAFTRPGVLDQTWSHVVGALTGRQVLRLRLQDLIVHTWDIEQSLDPPAVVPENFVRWGLAELAAVESLTAKHFQLGDVPKSATTENAASAYLIRFGR